MSGIDYDGNFEHSNYANRILVKTKKKRKDRSKLVKALLLDEDDDEWSVQQHYMEKQNA